jgi:hypothetical protein
MSSNKRSTLFKAKLTPSLLDVMELAFDAVGALEAYLTEQEERVARLSSDMERYESALNELRETVSARLESL